MMADIEGKVLLLLAASDLSATELRTFFKTIDRLGASRMLQKIDAIRNLALSGELEAPSRLSGFDRERMSDFDLVISNVERGLLNEAGLSKAEATRLLWSELLGRGLDGVNLPSPNKIAFRLWLARVLDVVPESLVTHLASKIRNEILHGHKSPSDWPLMGSGS